MITKSQQPLICGAATFRDYGRSVGNTKLAEIVVFLYKSTRASSTHKSISTIPPEYTLFPLESSSAKPITRALGFAPHTGIPPRIRRHTTARSYICHVRHGGGTPAARKSFDTPPFPHARHQTRPPLPTRPAGAFILPSRKHPGYYLFPPSDRLLTVKITSGLGSLAMLRVSAFNNSTHSRSD